MQAEAILGDINNNNNNNNTYSLKVALASAAS
jgi:hypothetical protein